MVIGKSNFPLNFGASNDLAQLLGHHLKGIDIVEEAPLSLPNNAHMTRVTGFQELYITIIKLVCEPLPGYFTQ